MKTKLYLAPVNGGPFNCLPAREVELEDDRICCNDVYLPWETNYHNCRLYVIGNEFGAVGAVWAQHDQDAFDTLVDQGLGDSFLISEDDQKSADEDEREGWAHLGNAGEPANLDNAWIQTVHFDPARDCRLLCRFAEARGNDSKTLDN